MAVTLTIELADAEQARLQQIAEMIQPGITGPEIKAWAEKTAKNQLRIRVMALYEETQQRAQRATRQAEVVEISEDWAEEE